MYYKVVLLDAIRDYDRPYIYKSKENFLPGQLVIVPFGQGNQPREGLVLGPSEAFSDVKTIVQGTEIYLDKSSLEAVFYLSDYYALPMASYVRLFLPKSLRVEPKRYLVPAQGLSSKELEVYYSGLSEKELLDKGLAHYHYSYTQSVRLPEQEVLLALLDEIGLEEAINKLPASYSRQREVLIKLKEAYPNFLPRSGESLSSIRALEKKGLLKRLFIPKELASSYKNLDVEKKEIPPLSHEEEEIFKGVKVQGGSLSHIKKRGFSGLSIYLHLARASLEEGKNLIFLFPDTSMIPRALEVFKSYFGDRVGLIHGRMGKKEYKSELLAYKEGRYPIMIASRMGLFLPIKEGDTLIMEYCQDDSYQSRNPYYHGLELASFYGRNQGVNVIFSSSFLPLEFHLREDIKKYSMVSDKKPSMELVDMRKELLSGNTSPISRSMQKEIEELLKSGGLGLLLMNKLNYASYIFCRSCGYVLQCPQCGSSLHLEKKGQQLFCPSCSYRTRSPKACPQCGSRSFKYYGGGIEMVKEEIEKLFPQAKILLVDARTMQSKDGYINLHRKLKERSLDLVIGTSIIARGFNYQIDFLGVINADFYLYLPSYRAAEKGYELLFSFMERARPGGRGLIQTYQPRNYVLQSLLEGSEEQFLDKELEIRKSRKLPPFNSYILVRVFGDKSSVDRDAGLLIEKLRSTGADVSDFYGHWLPGERRILIKGDELDEVKEKILELHTTDIQFSVEVDPIDSV